MKNTSGSASYSIRIPKPLKYSIENKLSKLKGYFDNITLFISIILYCQEKILQLLKDITNFIEEEGKFKKRKVDS